MSSFQFITRQCLSPDCKFRFPVHGKWLSVTLCPRCGADTEIIEEIMDSPIVEPGFDLSKKIHLEGLLDNIRSAFNVGSMFRTSDGAGLEHLHLCGITATPEHNKVTKTALGAEYSVPWTYYPNTISAAKSIKSDGMRLWALEGGQNAQSIYDAAHDVHNSATVLVIGNEVSGIDPGLLAECDRTIYIPMLGYKRSLNVAIAFSIAVYTLTFSSVLINQ